MARTVYFYTLSGYDIFHTPHRGVVGEGGEVLRYVIFSYFCTLLGDDIFNAS